MYGSCIGSNVISIQRDGNCLFRAVSYCMYNTEDTHSEITLSNINKIMNDWEYYTILISDQSMINNAKDYKYLLSKDGEYGGSVESTWLNRLFSNYLFRVQSITNTVDYTTGSIVFRQL